MLITSKGPTKRQQSYFSREAGCTFKAYSVNNVTELEVPVHKFLVQYVKSLLFSSMRGRQQLSHPVLRPTNGPNVRPQEINTLREGNSKHSLELNAS